MPTLNPSDRPAWMLVVDELAASLTEVDPAAFARIRAEFSDVGRRWFFAGQGRSGLSAAMVAMRVMHLGREAHVVGEVTAPSVRSGDGIVFFSSSGETPVTLSFARIARQEGALVVAVTGSTQSTLAGLADVVLVLPCTDSTQLGRNLFEQGALLVMDALVNDLARDVPDPAALLAYRHTNLQ
ncbi:MAG: SIS domain-containing protein [Propionicimonas sp.]